MISVTTLRDDPEHFLDEIKAEDLNRVTVQCAGKHQYRLIVEDRSSVRVFIFRTRHPGKGPGVMVDVTRDDNDIDVQYKPTFPFSVEFLTYPGKDWKGDQWGGSIHIEKMDDRYWWARFGQSELAFQMASKKGPIMVLREIPDPGRIQRDLWADGRSPERSQ